MVRREVPITTAKKSQLESKFENMLYCLGEIHLQLNSLKICKNMNVSKMIVYIMHLFVGSPDFITNSLIMSVTFEAMVSLRLEEVFGGMALPED
jgi:CRISPR/Cas system-associated protein endoribonuclease Cas2